MTADCPGCGLDKAVDEVRFLSGKKQTVKKKTCEPCTKAGSLVCPTCQHAHQVEQRVSEKVKTCKACSGENKQRKTNTHEQRANVAKNMGMEYCSRCTHTQPKDEFIGRDPQTGEMVKLDTCQTCRSGMAMIRREKTGTANDEKVADLEESYKNNGVYCPGHTVRGNKGCAYEIGNQTSMKMFYEGSLTKDEVCTSFDYHHPDTKIKGGGIADIDDPEERKEEKERTGTVLLCCSCHRIETKHYNHSASYNGLYNKNKKRMASDA